VKPNTLDTVVDLFGSTDEERLDGEASSEVVSEVHRRLVSDWILRLRRQHERDES
jgi:hypothetical protein